jgi:trehalose utilization protein
MKQPGTRREFLEATAHAAAGAPLCVAGALGGGLASSGVHDGDDRPNPIKVLVWDEQQPAQKQAYPNFLGNQIAGHLQSQTGISVRSASINDPGQGLASGELDDCHVLIWWGHVRHAEITPETGRSVVERIKDGKLSLIALHSAHWSTPFVEAMNERTRLDIAEKLRAGGNERVDIAYVAPASRYTVPKPDSRLTPYVSWRKYPDGRRSATVHLPLCCFPAYRGDGKPSRVKVLAPGHPIARGLPAEFEIAQTEMYDEPFHVPDPDEVILEERWASGEWFRSGAVWKLGKGRVFYFRPGHETYSVFKQPLPLLVLSNAVRWLASEL